MMPNLHSSAIERGQIRPTSRKRVTAQHTLERVRNNQRRHRAERREYIAMLELKLTHAEQQVNALKAELAQYQKQDGSRSFLGLEQRECAAAPQPSSRSVDSHTIGPHVYTMGRGTVTHSNPPLWQFLPPNSLRGPELVGTASPHAANDDTDNFYLNPVGAEPCCSSSHTLHPESLATGDHDHGFNPGSPPLLGSAPRSPIQASWHGAENESTMPCAEAYILIEQQNFKGVHQKDVASWLWTGFRRSPNLGEGCRVKTDLLFSLLTFISET